MQRRVCRVVVVSWLCGLGIGAGAAAQSGRPVRADAAVARPEARVQTHPVPHDGDAADDPAIWIHPNDPALSLVLGTDKRGGLHVYGIDGAERQVVGPDSRPNNVDVLYGFPLAGRTVDLAVATTQAPARRRGLAIWVIDAVTRRLQDATAGARIAVFGGETPYGACGYHSGRTGRFYVFVTDREGRIEQYELRADARGAVGATRVRALAVSSTAEGCVADDDLGFLYLAEEERGIWKFGAEPDARGEAAEGRLVARVGEHGLAADVEGLALYAGAQGRGYLVASSQGNDSYKVYERGGDNRYVLTIDPLGGRIDDADHTDGIAVSNCPTSRRLSRGVFIVHDGDNAGGNQNFKLYGWEDIAGRSLLVDVVCRARS